MQIFNWRVFKLFLIFSVAINLSFVAYLGTKSYKKYIQSKSIPLAVIQQNKWNGYDILEFNFKGFPAKIVIPNNPNNNKNWIWRTQFWDLEPQVDIALLEKGFYLAFIDVKDLYGSEVAVNRFNDFYDFVIKNFQLNKKVVLEGLSRGGLDAYNWASINTDKVFCIYADAPVCDLKSWPGGFGNGLGSQDDLEKCLAVYGLTQEGLLNFNNIPLYNCTKIAEAKIPVLHVCGDKDDVVPIEENTYKLAGIFRKAGGEIKIIVKDGVGHHPHSLANPEPIVAFIMEKTGNVFNMATGL